MKIFKKKYPDKEQETECNNNTRCSEFFTPDSSIKPISCEDTFQEFLLSDILKSHHCYSWFIEPHGREYIEVDEAKVNIEVGIEYKIALLPSDDAPENYSVPCWLFILPNNKLNRDNPDSYYLWTEMMDDLVLRYYKDSQKPVWTAAIKGGIETRIIA